MLVQSPNQVLTQKNEDKLQKIFNWLDSQERILSAQTVEEKDPHRDEIILLRKNKQTFQETFNELRTRGTQTGQEGFLKGKDILIQEIRQRVLQIINNFETVPAQTVRDEVLAQTVEDRESKGRKGLSQRPLPDPTSNHESCAPLAQYGRTSEDKGLEQNQKQIILEIHQKLLEIINKMTTGGNGGGSETEQKEDSVQTVPDDISKQREAGLAEGFPVQVRDSLQTAMARRSAEGDQTVQDNLYERRKILIRAICQKFLQIINNFETVPAQTVRDEVPAQTVEDRESKGRKGLSQRPLPDSTSNHESSAPLAQYGRTSEDKGLEQNQKQIILEIHQKLLEIINKMTTGGNGGGSETEQKEDSVQTVPDDISKQREAGLAEEILDQVRESYPCIETRGSVQGAQTVQNDVPEGMEEVRAQRIEDKILDYYKNKTSLRIVEKEKLDVSRAERKTPIGLDKDLMEVLEACDSTYLKTNITALINRVNKMPYDGNTKTFITHSGWRGQLEMKFVCIVIHKYMIGSLEASDYIICTYHYIRIVPAVPDSLVFLSGLYPRLREMALPDTTISSEQKKLIKRHFLNKLVKSGYLKIENKRLYIK